MKRFRKPEDIRTAVIGYGPSFHMGRHHFGEMRRVGMVPTAVADIDPARLRAAEAEFPGVATFPSAAAMLRKADVDLVAVVTPHNTHAKLVLQCLKAGRHVIVEKPMAIATSECDAMIAAARKADVMLTVHHNRHWDGCELRAVEQVRAGAIGEVVRVEAHMCGYGKPGDWWRSSKSISGGILFDWGVHLVEYGLQIIDSQAKDVTGFAKDGFWADKTPWKKDVNEDEAWAIARFASGAVLMLTLSSVDANPKRGWVEATGTKGSYVFDGRNWELITHKHGTTVSTKGTNPPSQCQEFYNNIAAHLTKGEKLTITPEWARRPIHIIDLACRSAVKGVALKTAYR